MICIFGTHKVLHDDPIAGGEESQDHADEVLFVPRERFPVPRVLSHRTHHSVSDRGHHIVTSQAALSVKSIRSSDTYRRKHEACYTSFATTDRQTERHAGATFLQQPPPPPPPSFSFLSCAQSAFQDKSTSRTLRRRHEYIGTGTNESSTYKHRRTQKEPASVSEQSGMGRVWPTRSWELPAPSTNYGTPSGPEP